MSSTTTTTSTLVQRRDERRRWLERFSAGAMAARSDADIEAELTSVRDLRDDAASKLDAAEKRVAGMTYIVGVGPSMQHDAAYQAKAAEQAARRSERKAAKVRRVELDDELAWARWLFWRRKRARENHAAHVALMAHLTALFNETDRWLRERREAAQAQVDAALAAAKADASEWRERVQTASKALAALEVEHRTRRLNKVLAGIARLAELDVPALEALWLVAAGLRDEWGGKPGEPGKAGKPALDIELAAQMRLALRAIDDELALRSPPPADGDDEGGDAGDGVDGQGGGYDVPPPPTPPKG